MVSKEQICCGDTDLISHLDNDSRYQEAARLVEVYQFASCSFLQRQLKIGFKEALRIVEMLSLNNLLPATAQRSTALAFANEWLACASPSDTVPSSFFEVVTGICFSDEDLSVAMLTDRDSADVKLSYSVRTAETWRSGSDVNPVVNSVLNDICTWPADGLAIKITVRPCQLLGRDLRQICSALLKRTNKHCSSALAIQYSKFCNTLVIEVIASKILLK